MVFLIISAMSGLGKAGPAEPAHVYGICANFAVDPQKRDKIHIGFQKQQAKCVWMATSSYRNNK